MKITITNSTTPFSLLFATNTTNTAAYIMGFINVDGVAALSQTSDNCINLSLPLCVCCNIREFGSNVKSTDDTSSTFVFPNKVNGGDILVYSEIADYKQCSKIIENNIQLDLGIMDNDWMMDLRLCYC